MRWLLIALIALGAWQWWGDRSIVQLSSYLVEARAGDGWRWVISLTREDTGNGACELIWAEQLELR